ncbi:MAG: hypothetical protein J6Y29_06720 [Clostridiales bacterium]|nr:hypothetical protein [Clostridiales bacterium]
MFKRKFKQMILMLMCAIVCLTLMQTVIAANGEFNFVDEETGVRFHAEAGIVPENAVMAIRQIIPGIHAEEDAEFSAILEDLDEAVRSQVEKLDAYIVDLLDGDSKPIQPDGYITVMIPVQDDFDQEDLAVLRVISGDDVMYESELTTIDGQKYCVFKTNHFSTYCLVDKIGKNDSASVYLPYIIYAAVLVSVVCLFFAMHRPQIRM